MWILRSKRLTVLLVALLWIPAPGSMGQHIKDTLPPWLKTDGAMSQTFATGLRPSSPKAFRTMPQFRIAPMPNRERPTKLMLTDYLPPVGNQGNQRSCACWATAYYAYTYAVAKQLNITPEQLKAPQYCFSPAFLYHLTGSDNYGRSLASVFDLLKTSGCATLAEMPYSDKDAATPPSPKATEVARRYKVRQVGLLNKPGEADPERLKTYLAETGIPFVIGIYTGLSGFPRQQKVPKDFIYDYGHSLKELEQALEEKRKSQEMTDEEILEFFLGLGGHAVTIVGYDDTKRAFRMVNSWGTEWGDAGFLWLSEDFIKNWGLEAWGIYLPGGPLARTPTGKYVSLDTHPSQ